MINMTKETSVSIDDVLPLYQAVGWTNYTNQPYVVNDNPIDADKERLQTQEERKELDGPTNLSGFHQNDGQAVEQQAHKIHISI